MESSEKKVWKGKLPRKKAKTKTFKHVKKHYYKDPHPTNSTTLVPTPPELDDTTMEENDPTSGASPCPPQESENDAESCEENLMVPSSPNDVLEMCEGNDIALQQPPSVVEPHAGNSLLCGDSGEQNSMDQGLSPICDVMAGEDGTLSIVERVALPLPSMRTSPSIDTADDVVVIKLNAEAMDCPPIKGSLLDTTPTRNNVVFQEGVLDKVALPTDHLRTLPIYSAGEHTVVKSRRESPVRCGLCEPLPIPTVMEGMCAEDADTQFLPIHEVMRMKVQEALVQLHLTTNCTVLSSTEGIKIGICATTTEHLIVQRSVYAKFNGEFIVGVHGRDLPREHEFWKNVESVPFVPDEASKFIENLIGVVRRLRVLEICRGVQKFQSAWKRVGSSSWIDSNSFHEFRYQETCRSNDCLMLVRNVGIKRCMNCEKLYRPLLKESKKRVEESTPNKFKPDLYCNSPEIKRRLAQQRKTIRRSAEEIARLKGKIDTLLEKDGVHIEEGTSDSLLNIVTDAEHASRLTDIQKLFIEQQIEAASKKSSTGMTWHPAMIRIALALRMTSGPAYEELRGILHLPCERTHFNYSHHIEVEDGINSGIIADLADEVSKSNLKPHQLLHLVMFDEVYIKRNLVYKKGTGEMVGYAKLLPVDQEIAALDVMLSDEVMEASNPTAPQPQLATKMLSYVVVGVCSDIKGVVACHGVANMNAVTLDRLTWNVVGALEANGLPVVALVADGASTNAKFFQMQKPVPGYPCDGVVYATPNVFDPDRPVFLLSDPPHLLKTTRNCLYSSGKISKKTKKVIRLLKKNGQFMRWETIERLYILESKNTCRKMFHLNKADVYLDSNSVMNVNFAAHVLSQSTADCIRTNGWGDCEELAVLCEKTNATFDMLNGSYSVEGSRHRNPRLNAYEKSDDDRFGELTQYWEYLKKWQEEVEAQEVTDKNEDKKRFLLSRQTMEGWERCIKGFCGAVKYILGVAEKHGDKVYIYARKFSQDYLEHFFGKLRGSLGGNRNPDLNQALRTTARSHVHRKLNFRGRKKGNTRVSKSLSLEDLSKPLPKKPRKSVP